MEVKGLIIGLDIQRTCSMACYYNWKSKAITEISFDNQENALVHEDFFKSIENSTGAGEMFSLDTLAEHIELLIEAVRNSAMIRGIQKLVITVEDYNVAVLDVLRAVMKKLLIPEEVWSIYSHQEVFAYYVYSQPRELSRGGVLLLDYKENGLNTYYMTAITSANQELVVGEENNYSDDEIIEAVSDITKFSSIEDILIEHINEALGQRIISCIYLTGKGFARRVYSEKFTQMICRRRKAFAGENLFVKGACYSAIEEIAPDKFKNITLACKNRITSWMETDILERGRDKRLIMIRPGVNWYMSEKEYDFIIDDIRKINIYIRPCNKNIVKKEEIDISELPYREGKLTRITLRISFASDSRCLISVIDRGFGDFAESSGKVVERVIEL